MFNFKAASFLLAYVLAEPLTAVDTESTSRMIILIVVAVFFVAAAVAIWLMWRRSRRRLPRPNGQVPRPAVETEDLSTVLQNPGFISSGTENEQLSGLPIRLADDDADDSTVYHELHTSSPSPNEELMNEFYPIEIPEDDRG
ncbi:Hypp7431 [Branchiostoma lanceolatum]|uniref:Hypp7431 protein n=1 Tax=Branchiostoma lanceolatum TaxID=7740 RepID=A0A8K0EA92_BRALA|nr:Hypp7431 [Branchiostoma lanceolatum]